MASGQMNPVLRHIRQLAGEQPDEQSDRTLLERFAAGQEEAVFEALLRRHGPLVLGVCQRVLNHEQDAEDVFQATFLVLARKAADIRKQASLGSWLYGVAYRLALKARAAAARRRDRERRCGAMLQTDSDSQAAWRELRPVLDEELARLPFKHRAPLILCYLEGKTHAEAARTLGWSLGSMSKRLSRARALLRRRLERRGMTLSAALLVMLLGTQTRAALPAGLVQASLKAALLVAAGQTAAGVATTSALNLMGGGLRAMVYAKLFRLGTLMLACALAVGGIGWVTQNLSARPDAPDQPAAPAADPREAETQPAGQPDLSFVPAEALGFTHINMRRFWTSSLGKDLRQRIERAYPDALAEIRKRLGVDPGDLESITAIMFVEQRTPRGPAGEPLLLALTTRQPYRLKSITEALGLGNEQHAGDRTYYTSNNVGPGLAPVSNRTFIIGAAGLVEEYLKMERSGPDSPLASGLKAAGGAHLLVAGFHVPAYLTRELKHRPLPPTVQFLQPVLNVKSGTLVADLDRGKLSLKATARFPGAEAAREAQDATRVGLNMLAQALQELPAPVRRTSGFAELFKEAQQSIRKAQISHEQNVVHLSMETTALPLVASAIPAITQMRQASARVHSQNNLKQMALAMHNYLSTFNHFPPAAITDKNGKPLLSWRVAILPFVEQDALYRQFHLDEPWDSAHNKKLLAQMPPIYVAPTGKTKGPHETFYQVFTGPGTIFDGIKGAGIAQITDGTSNTILIVEAGNAVPWTKPEDLPFDPDKPLPRLGGLFEDGFNAAFADGSVRFIKKTINPTLLKALITANGGEVIDSTKIP